MNGNAKKENASTPGAVEARITIAATLGALKVMRFTLGSHAPRFQVHNPVIVPAAHCPSVSGTVRVPMLKLDFLGHYDVADMLMLAASVVVVVSILIAI